MSTVIFDTLPTLQGAAKTASDETVDIAKVELPDDATTKISIDVVIQSIDGKGGGSFATIVQTYLRESGSDAKLIGEDVIGKDALDPSLASAVLAVTTKADVALVQGTGVLGLPIRWDATVQIQPTTP